nr:MAG TPA: hypothetical protein [Caudoviricetes sp.]
MRGHIQPALVGTCTDQFFNISFGADVNGMRNTTKAINVDIMIVRRVHTHRHLLSGAKPGGFFAIKVDFVVNSTTNKSGISCYCNL